MVDIISFVDNLDSWMIITLIIIILILEVFMLAFPKEILLIYAGLKFGIFYGGLINLIGLFGAAWLGFEGGLSGRFGLEKRRNQRVMRKYQDWLNENGLKSLIVLRLIPLTPNDILSVSCGFSKIRRKPYLSISFVTAIPYALFFAWFGSEELFELFQIFPQIFDPVNWIFSFTIILIALVYLVKKITSDQPEPQFKSKYE